MNLGRQRYWKFLSQICQDTEWCFVSVLIGEFDGIGFAKVCDGFGRFISVLDIYALGLCQSLLLLN
jgi:hypothetical protein